MFVVVELAFSKHRGVNTTKLIASGMPVRMLNLSINQLEVVESAIATAQIDAQNNVAAEVICILCISILPTNTYIDILCFTLLYRSLLEISVRDLYIHICIHISVYALLES